MSDPVKFLAEWAGRARSGILTATRGKHRRLICLDGGRIAFVASNMIEEQPEEHLLRHGLLDPDRRAELQALVSQSGKKAIALVREKGWVDPDALDGALEEHARNLVLSILQWKDAEIDFQEGRPKLDAGAITRLSCVPLVLQHVQRFPQSIDKLRIRIGPPDIRPIITDRAEEMIADISLSEAARSVLTSCDGTRDLRLLVSQSKFERDEVLRPLYAFLLLGIVVPTTAQAGEKGAVLAQVSREEVEARLHQAEGADCYLVLGVDRKATAAEVREAYYLLARRFHPDRFGTGPLADLRSQIERYFTQVTEAHNTLSDTERRAQYDEELAKAVSKKKEPEQDTAYLARENFARASMLLERGRYQDAVTFLENAVQLDPKKAEYPLELGRVLIRNPRRRADAELQLQRAIELDPTSVAAYNALGQLYARMSRPDDARQAYGEALRWEPENTEARKGLDGLGG